MNQHLEPGPARSMTTGSREQRARNLRAPSSPSTAVCLRRGLAVAIALLLVGATETGFGQGPPPAPVRVDPALQEDLQERRSATGEIRARRSSRVATQEPGLVLELAVREGDRVEVGQVLVRLDSERLRIELEEAQADGALNAATLEEYRALEDQAAKDLAALERLKSRGGANPKELSDAQTEVVAARARVRQASERQQVSEKRIKLLERRLSDTEIKAPFAGAVVELFVDLGEWVGEGDGILQLASVGELEVWLAVSEKLLGSVRQPGTTIEVAIPAAGRQIESDKYRVVPQMEPGSRQFALIVPIVGDTSDLAPGMSVAGKVPSQARTQQITVHRDAILRGETGAYVYAVRGEGQQAHAALTPVQVLFSTGPRVVVRGPLAPGDAIVVEGNERLFPMAPVIPQPVETPSPAPTGKKRSSR